MPRTPLMHLLQRAIRKAAEEKGLVSESRRKLLQRSIIAGVGLAVPSFISACGDPRSTLAGMKPNVVIVGAGIAGMNAAETLRKHGIQPAIYEASGRVGGRIMSVRNLLFKDTTTELGGELIDSDDAELHRLASELGLEMLDMKAPPLDTYRDAYYFQGHHYTEADIVREIGNVLEHIASEVHHDKVGKGATGMRNTNVSNPSAGSRESIAPFAIDGMSIEAYFDHLGLSGWLRSFLQTAYVAENGLDLHEQSAMNFTTSIGLDVSTGTFSVYGMSDERYKIRGGNEQLVERLAQRHRGHIRTNHVLEQVRHTDNGYSLSFRKDQNHFEVPADYLILALPFTTLRNVSIHAQLPSSVTSMISALSYGTNAKVLAAYEKPFWNQHEYNGSIYTDLPIQLAWDNTAMQGIEGGGLTFFSGGSVCRELMQLPNQDCSALLVQQLGTIWPSAADHTPSRVNRFDWANMPWVKASYSTFSPGQWKAYSGVLQQGFVNNTLQFAGEHCSDSDRGFMNGAALTGRQAAERILVALGIAI